jgi:hypothetical protein
VPPRWATVPLCYRLGEVRPTCNKDRSKPQKADIVMMTIICSEHERVEMLSRCCNDLDLVTHSSRHFVMSILERVPQMLIKLLYSLLPPALRQV